MIKQQRRVSLVLVPVMAVVVIGLMAWSRHNQWGQFWILLVGLILVDQARPGRLLNHLVTKLIFK